MIPGFSEISTISPWKAVLLRVLMAVIMLLTGVYVGFQWAGYLHHFESDFPAPAGFVRTALCAVLVWMMGSSALETRDGRLLGVAFAITLIADWFLIVKNELKIGTLIFLAVHTTLIIRHAQGFGESVAPERRARNVPLLVGTAVVAYGGAATLLWMTAPGLEAKGVFWIDAVYLLFLATSMWMAWGVLIRRFYPARNAWFIAVGTTAFYACDVSVGLAAVYAGTTFGSILNNLVGFFYSPALVMLAFSGYRWSEEGPPVSERSVALT
jgi:hypothetical protein